MSWSQIFHDQIHRYKYIIFFVNLFASCHYILYICLLTLSVCWRGQRQWKWLLHWHFNRINLLVLSETLKAWASPSMIEQRLLLGAIKLFLFTMHDIEQTVNFSTMVWFIYSIHTNGLKFMCDYSWCQNAACHTSLLSLLWRVDILALLWRIPSHHQLQYVLCHSCRT